MCCSGVEWSDAWRQGVVDLAVLACLVWILFNGLMTSFHCRYTFSGAGGKFLRCWKEGIHVTSRCSFFVEGVGRSVSRRIPMDIGGYGQSGVERSAWCERIQYVCVYGATFFEGKAVFVSRGGTMGRWALRFIGNEV